MSPPKDVLSNVSASFPVPCSNWTNTCILELVPRAPTVKLPLLNPHWGYDYL